MDKEIAKYLIRRKRRKTGGYCKVGFVQDMSNKKIEIILFLIGLFISTYFAFFALAWVKYEFIVNRQAEHMNSIMIMMASEKYKNYSKHLSYATNMYAPIEPSFFNFRQTISSIIFPDNSDMYDLSDNHSLDVAWILEAMQDWTNSYFINLDLRLVSLTNIDFSASSFDRVSISGGCGLIDLKFTNSTIALSTFIDSYLSYTYIDHAILKHVKLTNSTLYNVDFSHSTMQNVNFSNATIMNCAFNDTSFTDVDFTNAEIEDSNFQQFYYKNQLIDDDFADAKLIIEASDMFMKARYIHNATFPFPIDVMLDNHSFY